MAVVNYHDVNGHYPPAYIADADGNPMHSWRVLILPYIEEHNLFDEYDFTKPWNSEANLRLAERMPAIYALHGEYQPGVVTTNYLAVVGENTLWPGAAKRMTHEVTDKHSATIMLVENVGQNVHWMEPRDLNYDTMSLQVNSPNGVSSKYQAPAVVLLDDSLRRLEDELTEDVFRALLTVNGGEHLAESGDSWKILTDGRLRQEREVDVNSPQ